MPSHRGPFAPVQPVRLAQHRGVDRDLAEVVEPSRPPQAVDIGERQLQCARQLVDVSRDANGMAVRRRIALVDDVGKGLEPAKRFALQSRQSDLKPM